ncbi:MAG: T9SS type A sorting domain-containing protein, partial [Bacteroidetes bacterium]|nr:T9SS type A sorting domain-containing protein [Bacteroidota bacterium]
ARDLTSLTSQVDLTLDGVTEIADETGTVQEVDLTMPKLAMNTEQASVSVYPNPFRNRTEFVYTLPEQSNVIIKVYDMLGNEVSTLVNEMQNANTYHFTFDATKLLPGVYTYKVTFNGTKEEVRTGRLVITK